MTEIDERRLTFARKLSFRALLAEIQMFANVYLAGASPEVLKLQLATFAALLAELDSRLEPPRPSAPTVLQNPDVTVKSCIESYGAVRTRLNEERSKQMIDKWTYDARMKDLRAEMRIEVAMRRSSSLSQRLAYDRAVRQWEAEIQQRRQGLASVRELARLFTERATGARSRCFSPATIWWRILPPGHEPNAQVVQHFEAQVARHPKMRYDFSRLALLQTLKPSAQFVGMDEWDGYVVFLYEHTTKAVLDCPIYGNAVYVITRDWHSVSKLTKAEVLLSGENIVRRIVHAGNWFKRLQQEIVGQEACEHEKSAQLPDAVDCEGDDRLRADAGRRTGDHMPGGGAEH